MTRLVGYASPQCSDSHSSIWYLVEVTGIDAGADGVGEEEGVWSPGLEQDDHLGEGGHRRPVGVKVELPESTVEVSSRNLASVIFCKWCK